MEMTATEEKVSVLAWAPVSSVLRCSDLERAKAFYRDVLGLPLRDIPDRAGEVQVLAGAGTLLCLYERPAFPAPQNTVACFEVPDVRAAVDELRERGVTFEEIDMPELGLVTENGVALIGAEQRAWFRDSEGNTIVLRRARGNVEG